MIWLYEDYGNNSAMIQSSEDEGNVFFRCPAGGEKIPNWNLLTEKYNGLRKNNRKKKQRK